MIAPRFPLVVIALLLAAAAAAEGSNLDLTVRQLSPHIQDFQKWKLKVENRVGLLKTYSPENLRSMAMHYSDVRAEVNPLLDRIGRDVSSGAYRDPDEYKGAILVAEIKTSDFVNQSDKLLHAPDPVSYVTRGLRWLEKRLRWQLL